MKFRALAGLFVFFAFGICALHNAIPHHHHQPDQFHVHHQHHADHDHSGKPLSHSEHQEYSVNVNLRSQAPQLEETGIELTAFVHPEYSFSINCIGSFISSKSPPEKIQVYIFHITSSGLRAPPAFLA